MAHVGQEGALGPVGGLRGLLRGRQRLLVALALGDVGDAGADQVASRGRHADETHLARDVLPGRVAVRPLEHRRAAGEGLTDLLARGFQRRAAVGLHRRAHVAGSDLEQLLARQAIEARGVAVGVGEQAGVGVDDDDGLRGVLEEGTKPLLALTQGFLGPAALGELLAGGEVHASVGGRDRDEARELAHRQQVAVGEPARAGTRGHRQDHDADAVVIGGDRDGGEGAVAGTLGTGVRLGPRRVGAPGLAEQAGVVGPEGGAERLRQASGLRERDQRGAVMQVHGGPGVAEVLRGVPQDRGDEGGELDLLAEAALDVVHGREVLVMPGHANLRRRRQGACSPIAAGSSLPDRHGAP